MTRITQLMMQDAMAKIPPEVTDRMIWPVQYMGDECDWTTIIFMLARSDSKWYIWEYWPNIWHINTDVPSQESGLDWMKFWLRDNAPEFAELYFP